MTSSLLERVSEAEAPPAASGRSDSQGWMSWAFQQCYAPVDIASVVYFRILFGAILAYHIYKMCASRWVEQLYIHPVLNFPYYGFGWVKPWPDDWMYPHFYVMGIAAVGICVGFCYRFCALVMFLGMAHVFLIEKAFYLNHYYLITLLCGLLIVIPAHRALSVDAWLRPGLRSSFLPAWCLGLLRFQLGIPYLYGGIAKIESDWLQGYPLKMWLQRSGDVPLIGATLQQAEWAPLVFSYGGLLLDLLIVPLLLFPRTRWFAYLAGLGFHVLNSQLFDIGVFPWLMIGATLLFFPADWPRRLVRLPKPIAPASELLPKFNRRAGWAMAGLAIYGAWQILLPFRAALYPGSATWTEEGHHFAWHMMLREKDVGIRFYIRNPQTGEGGVADARSFLTERQMSRMAKDSDMILTFVHFLRDHFREHGMGDLQIRVLALVSLNGRKPQLMMDPTLDYTLVERTWLPQPWILPLKEPLRRDPWVIPLEEWEDYVEVPSSREMLMPARNRLALQATTSSNDSF